MTFFKQATIFLALASFLFQSQLAFCQDGKSETPDFIRVPVYFITDRENLNKKQGDTPEFSGERQYFGLCKHDPHLGIAYCNIANTEHKPLSATASALGWTASQHDGEGPDGAVLSAGNNYDEKKTSFYEKLYEQSKLPQDHEIFIFAPGYMSTFESGLRSAARLGYYAERPVVLYSWASKGKFTAYFADEATIEWTQDHFNDMLTRLGELGGRAPGLRARLFAHSMGGRLVLRATPLLKSNPAFKEISVVCPDVDDGVVKHYAAKYFDGKGNQLVRLYVSKRDVMLKISQAVHGGYSRFGEEQEPLDNLIPVHERTVKADSPDPPSVSGDKCLTHASPNNSYESLSRKLLTIDFTAVDIGTLGHRIPVELLCSLSQKGLPGNGLSLVMARQKVVRGKLKNASQTQIQEDDTEADPDDGVVRVLSDKRWHGTPLIGLMVKYRPRIRLLLTKDWSLK